jgi:hypothetical protein
MRNELTQLKFDCLLRLLHLEVLCRDIVLRLLQLGRNCVIGLQHLFYNDVQLCEIVTGFGCGITVRAVSAPWQSSEFRGGLPLDDAQHQIKA